MKNYNEIVGLESRKVDMKDLLHGAHPDSTLFATGK
jgi:hypothetical protein